MPLPTLLTTTVANACSSDGSVIVGSAPSGGGTVACWWDKATQTLTLLTQPSGITFSSAYDCSSDGSIIIGNDDNSVHAYWWDKTTGTPTELLPPSGGNQAQVFSCSSDGSVITGFYNHPVTGTHACWWDKTTGVPTPLNDLSAISIGANARAVSADGTIAVGVSVDDSDNMQPVWWLISTGVVTAMSWPGGNQPSETLVNGDGPRDCSSDGSIIVGSGNDSSFNTIACFWDKSTGTPTLLQQISGSTNGGRALGVSDNGITICGWALDSSFNQSAVIWNKTSNTISLLDFDPSADTTFSDGGIGISADGTIVVGDNYINPGDVQTAVFWGSVSPPNPIDLFLQGRVFSASRAREQINFVTTIRARIRANSRLKGLLNWPDYSLSLQAKVTSGARAFGALVPGNTVLAARIRTNASLRQLLSGVTNIPVFPTLPVGFPVVVKPTFANISGSIPSGRSMRAPQQTVPIWEFELNFESLRDQTQNSQPFLPLTGFTDFTKLAQVFIANIGQYGKFLFDAWWDDSRLDQPIALGDGTSTRFLMVRIWGYGPIQFTEPVGSVNVVTNVKFDGAIVNPSTYNIQSNNILVFNTPPTNGVIITSTFSYYYLCQFSEDMQDYSEFMKNRWTAKIKFRSVEGATPFTLAGGPTPFPPPIPPGQYLINKFSNLDIYAVSDNGSFFFGQASTDLGANLAPCWWDADGNRTTLDQISPNIGGIAQACTSDGSKAVGWLPDGSGGFQAVVWNRVSGTFTELVQELGETFAQAYDCSSDGSIAVGMEKKHLVDDFFVFVNPVWWNVSLNSITIMSRSVYNFSRVLGCSSNGDVIVGAVSHDGFAYFACWWDRLTGNITILEPLFASAANGISADGTIIVGEIEGNAIGKAGSAFYACWWETTTGVRTILAPFMDQGDIQNDAAIACSKDGSIIVGRSGNFMSGDTAFFAPTMWDKISGIATPMPGLFNVIHSGNVRSALAITPDASVIAGGAPVIPSSAGFDIATFWRKT